MLPVVNKAAEHAPMATACCNACRTCATTNIVTFAFAGVGAITAFFGRRFVKPS
jgi:hypothetical protein